MTEQEAAALLNAEMDKQGVTDNDIRAGIAAIAMGESQMNPHTETAYTHTANERIREVFGSRVADMTDEQIDQLKADPRLFFNAVYGGAWGAHNNLGNTEADDGYNFRGRTMLQLTGRANYQKLQDLTGYQIVADPDSANEPAASAAIAVGYMRWRYHGGGWTAMKAAVGVNTSDIDATKNRYYEQFTASGEFDAGQTTAAQSSAPEHPDIGGAAAPSDASAPATTDTATPQEVVDLVKTIQSKLTTMGMYRGPIDGRIDPGGATQQAARLAWQMANG